MKPPFSNPYSEYTGVVARINAIIPEERFERVKRCRLSNGTIQVTISILWEKLIHELDRLAINDCTDDERFEDFVLGCRLVGGGTTAGVALPETAIANVGQRIERPHNVAENATNVGADLSSDVKIGKRQLGGKTIAGKKAKDGKCA